MAFVMYSIIDSIENNFHYTVCDDMWNEIKLQIMVHILEYMIVSKWHRDYVVVIGNDWDWYGKHLYK